MCGLRLPASETGAFVSSFSDFRCVLLIDTLLDVFYQYHAVSSHHHIRRAISRQHFLKHCTTRSVFLNNLLI